MPSTLRRSLYELVEDAAPARGKAAWRVWAQALDAILHGTLPTTTFDARGLFLPGRLPDPMEVASLDASTPHGMAWRRAIEGDLHYVSANKRVPPYFAHRYGMVTLDPSIFRRWLDGVSLSPPKRRAGAKSTKRQAIRDFVAARYREGIPPHIKLDSIRSDFERDTGCAVSDRTLRRALGRR